MYVFQDFDCENDSVIRELENYSVIRECCRLWDSLQKLKILVNLAMATRNLKLHFDRGNA